MSADGMAGRSLGPWRLRPERQDAEERVWSVSLDLGHGAPEAVAGTVATIAWRRPSREWVLECLPPLHGLRASWTGPGDWPPAVPLRVWRSAVAELGAASFVCLRMAVGMLGRLEHTSARLLEIGFQSGSPEASG